MVILYSEKLLTGGGMNIVNIMGRFVQDLLRVVGVRSGVQEASSSVSTPLYLLSVNVFLLGLIIVPILLYVPYLLKKKTYENTFFSAIILTGALDITAYVTLAGHVDLKCLYLFFPICALIALVGIRRAKGKKSKRGLSRIYAIVLLSVVALRFGLYAIGPYSSSLRFDPHDLNQFETIVRQSGSSKIFLTDNVAGGKILVSLAQNGFHQSVAVYQFASPQSISFLYSGKPEDLTVFRSSNQTKGYIVISGYDLKGNFPAQGWQSFAPFKNFTRVVDVPSVEVIYQGLDVTILKIVE
jgi:hypothetical protein